MYLLENILYIYLLNITLYVGKTLMMNDAFVFLQIANILYNKIMFFFL